MNASSLLAGCLLCAVPVSAALSAEPAKRGATVPWVSIEAEQASTNGKILGPDYTSNTAASEASGRQCVNLSSAGQFVEFSVPKTAQGLVIRYSIPDSSDGQGIDSNLSLHINGKPVSKLQLTSRLSYLYGPYPFSNDPSKGQPRNFWDELRLQPGELKAGDVVRLQKDDDAAPCSIDFVDFEAVPPPLIMPANSVSVLDFGAMPDDQTDDRIAFQKTIDAGRAQKRTIWIPPGKFIISGSLSAGDVDIQGAGMWYSQLIAGQTYAPNERVAIYGDGTRISLADFSIIGQLNYRNDAEANDGIGESLGKGSVIRNLWIEHTKAGIWVINSDELLIENCRFRNTIADGVNLCLGVRNSIIRNCTARGTGDDCFAMWPATYAAATGRHGNNTFIRCTAQLPFLAQAFSIYGGHSNRVEGCSAIDIPYGAGLFASTTFPTVAGFEGMTSYSDNHILRAGGTEGAIGIIVNLTDLAGLRFEDIDVVDSPRDGVRFVSVKQKALQDAMLDNVRINNVGLSGKGTGVVASPNAIGAVTLDEVRIENARTKAWENASDRFEFVRGTAKNSSGTVNDQLKR